MTIRPPRCAAPALALLLLAGCSNDSDVLARVGRAAITRDDFLAAAQGGGLSYPGPPDSAKVHLLEDLVRRELMVQGAVAAGLHHDPRFLEQRGRLEDQALRDRLVRELGGGARPPVSDAEIAEFHRQRGEETRVRVIYLYTEPLARVARAELDAGRPFEEVARRFNPGGIMPPDGDLGWMAPGSLIEPIDGLVRTARPGALMGPIDGAGQGWFIVRVGERRRREQAPLEVERAQIGEMLRQRKQRAVMTRAIDGLRREYAVSLRPGAAQHLVARVAAGAPAPGSPEITIESLTRLPTLSESERGTILAEYRGGVYTLGDAFADLDRPDQQRPNFLVLPGVESWLQGMALERAARVEARRRRYQDDPEMLRALRQRSNNLLLDAYYNARVIGGAAISPAHVRARYDAHAASLVRLDGVRVLTVVLRDSAAAAQLMAHAGHAGTLREAAAMAVPESRVREERVRFPTGEPRWQPLEAAFMGMAPGEYSGPHPVDSGWMVVQLRSKDQRIPRFEDLPPGVAQQLESEAIEIAREARLMALTDSLRGRIPVRTWPERLRRVPWPSPPANPFARG